MKILSSNDFLSRVLPQSILFALLWSFTLNASRSLIFVIFASVLIIFLVRDFLLGLITIFLGVGFSALVIKFDEFAHFFIGNDVSRLYFLVIFSIFLVAIFVKRFNSGTKQEIAGRNLNYNFVILFFALLSFLLFEIINRQTKIHAMKYLVSTGEDNAAWLYGMSGGINTNENIFDLESSSSYSGATTAIISTTIRGIQKFENGSYALTDNILNLQRIFALCMVLGVFLVGLATYRYAIKGGLSFLNSFVISALSGLVTYLGFVSFALYGHLTPSESLLFLFAFLALLTFNHKEEVRYKKFKNSIIYVFTLILLFAASEAWWPLAPAMYLAIGLVLINFLTSINSSFRSRKFIIFIGLLLITAFLIFNNQILKLVKDNFLEFTNKLHIPGGTMSLGLVHIILLIGSLVVLISIKKINNLSETQGSLLRILLISLFTYYFVTIFLSQVTPPYTVSYAGFKLGLFAGVFVLPISIVLLAFYINKRFQFKYANLFYCMGAFLIFMNAGPPTSPSNPAWNQIGFPFGLINAIEADPNGGWIWVKPMIETIDKNEDKRVLCYQSNQNSIDPFQLHICHRFVTSLQGFEREPVVGLWYQVIDNAIRKEEFAKLAPVDFFEVYKVLDLSLYAPKTESISSNNINEFLTPP